MHLYSVLMVIHNIQLSGNFREKREKKYSRELRKKLSRGLMLEPWRLSQLKTLTWTFRSQTTYIIHKFFENTVATFRKTSEQLRTIVCKWAYRRI